MTTRERIGRFLCTIGWHRWRVRSQSIAISELECVRCREVWLCSHDGQTWWQR